MANYVERHITHRNGDTLEATQYHIQINSVDADLTGAKVCMQVREDFDSDPVLDLNVGDGITLVDPTGGIFEQDRIDELFIEPNINKKYKYDIQITFADGKNRTYFGGTFTLIATVADKGV